MRLRSYLAPVVLVLAIAEPATGQGTALRRTQLTNDLLALDKADSALFNFVLGQVPNGATVRAFLDTPSPGGAPSIAVLEQVVRDLRAANPVAFAGGGAFDAILLSAGGGAGAAAASLPATGLVLRATAEFLAGRVRDELAIEYVDLLLELTGKPIVDSLTVYSRRALGLVHETNYRSVLPLLRESVVRDLRMMPERLTTESTYARAARKPDRAALSHAALGVRLSRDVLESKPVLDVLIGLERLRPLTERRVSPDSPFVASDALRHALIVSGALAREIKAHRENADSILRAHDRSVIYFASFLAADLLRDRQRFPGVVDATEVAAVVAARYRAVEDAMVLVRELQEAVEAARDAGGQDVVGAYLRVMDRLTGITAVAGAVVSDGQQDAVHTMNEAMRQIAEAYAAWSTANYAGMFADVIALSTIMGTELLNDEARRYLVFATSFANANTSDEMVTVLESAALPPAGYRGKRERPALGLTAYGGGAGYWEDLDGGDGALAGGIAFPVAAEFSFPWRPSVHGVRWRTSVSLLLTALDLGNLVSLREGEGTPDPALDQVLAPGFGVQFGFGAENPWSIGVLAQRVPDLRDDGRQDVVRVGAFVGIDMPIFRLWTP